MAPRIAMSMPHGLDLQYAERAVSQYERAIALAGGEPVRIGLKLPDAAIANTLKSCDGVLLPGSKADIDPERFHVMRSPHAASADPRRESVDNLLLDHAFHSRKPVLGICYGLQSLNVYLSGSLIQHIPDFLPESKRAKVNHEAGKSVAVAHTVAIEANSKLGAIIGNNGSISGKEGKLILPVNSSHHQSADAIGHGLRIVARCSEDDVIEAVEGTSADHFVLAVQWHPERSVDGDEASRAIFRALIDAAIQKKG